MVIRRIMTTVNASRLGLGSDQGGSKRFVAAVHWEACSSGSAGRPGVQQIG